MALVIWDQRGNPPKYVSDRLAFSTGNSAMRLTKLRPRAIFVLGTALSSMITVWSQMSTVIRSGISMTNSENTIRTFATLRFAGDELDPDEISRVVKEKPTR